MLEALKTFLDPICTSLISVPAYRYYGTRKRLQFRPSLSYSQTWLFIWNSKNEKKINSRISDIRFGIPKNLLRLNSREIPGFEIWDPRKISWDWIPGKFRDLWSQKNAIPKPPLVQIELVGSWVSRIYVKTYRFRLFWFCEWFFLALPFSNQCRVGAGSGVNALNSISTFRASDGHLKQNLSE